MVLENPQLGVQFLLFLTPKCDEMGIFCNFVSELCETLTRVLTQGP